MQSTLAANFTDLQGDVGHYLGYGRGADFDDHAWTTTQQANITRCVQGGLRRFYNCGHDWSFLKPVASLTLASGATVVHLPDDCGGVEGRITVSVSGSTTICCTLDIGPIGRVYDQAARYPDTTGQPELCCVEVLKGTSHTKGQRQQLHVFPTSDQAYTLRFAYYVNPDYLTGSLPYAYGGPQHAETLLAACKATAERELDNMHDGPQGLDFQRLLAQSQDMDRRLKPQTAGYNRDLSDELHNAGYWNRTRLDQTVTIAGLDPDA